MNARLCACTSSALGIWAGRTAVCKVPSFEVCALQCVCITDPVLATQVLRSKAVDKMRFPYSFLDPVRPCPHPASWKGMVCAI